MTTTPDPREQAEQRLARGMAMSTIHGQVPSAVHAWIVEKCAKLAAEEIAKVALVVGHDDRDDCWLGAPGYPPVPEGHVHPHPPRPVPWHLVCADVEKP